jgi:hypothetical protein
MSSSTPCRYCGSDVSPRQQRCRECESWLTWRAFLTYPDTIWSQLGLVVSIAAALFAWMHALEARADREAAQALRADVGAVATHVTRVAAVISDGAGRAGALPAAHVEQISRETEALLPHLPATFDADVRGLLEDLKRKMGIQTQEP